MNANKLFDRLKAYGADMDGIKGRFMDEKDFYMECFRDFLVDPAFAELETAVADGDPVRAFNASHALKGISANLGLTSFYEVVCELVESARQGDLVPIKSEYGAVLRELKRLEKIYK